MKVLYCSWYENSREDLECALNKAADEVIVIEHKVKEYLGLNENIRQEIISIVDKGIDIIISFDFIPILSEICNCYNIQYVSWIYDWPNYTLFCKEVYRCLAGTIGGDRYGRTRLYALSAVAGKNKEGAA